MESGVGREGRGTEGGGGRGGERLPPAQQPFHKIISGFSRQFSPATKKKKVCERAAL